MDLSSLEGPPVYNPRFTVDSCESGDDRPRIEISPWDDDTQDELHPSLRGQQMGQFFTGAIQLDPSDIHYIWGSPQSGSLQRQSRVRRNLRASDNGETNARGRPHSAEVPTVSYSYGTKDSCEYPTPRHSRSQSSLPACTRRAIETVVDDTLVWSEDRQLWVMTRLSSPHPNTALWREPSPSDQQQPESSPDFQPPPSQHEVPYYDSDIFLEDELPPPYESLFGTNTGTSQESGHSLWSEIARRVIGHERPTGSRPTCCLERFYRR
jgi:hypothetical protein